MDPGEPDDPHATLHIEGVVSLRIGSARWDAVRRREPVIECIPRAERLLAAETMKPKLREIEVHSILHQGQPMLLLRDGLRLSETTIAVRARLGRSWR